MQMELHTVLALVKCSNRVADNEVVGASDGIDYANTEFS